MSVGDLKNNLRKFLAYLKSINYAKDVDCAGISSGNASAFLPVYHYLFLEYSRPVASLILSHGAELTGKTDLRFMETVYKVLRDLFSYKPPLTKDQFFTTSYAERKVMMCSDVIALIREKHFQLAPRQSNRKRETSSKVMEAKVSSVNPVEVPESSVVNPETASVSTQRVQFMTDVLSSSSESTEDQFDGVPAPLPSTTRCSSGSQSSIDQFITSRNVHYNTLGLSDDTNVHFSRMSEQSNPAINGTADLCLPPIDVCVHESGQQYPVEIVDKHMQPKVIQQLVERMEREVQKVSTILSRISDLESRLTNLVAKPTAGGDAGGIQNVLARLTLLENRMNMLEYMNSQATSSVFEKEGLIPCPDSNQVDDQSPIVGARGRTCVISEDSENADFNRPPMHNKPYSSTPYMSSTADKANKILSMMKDTQTLLKAETTDTPSF